ncbi:MAG: FAD:protein FMN transferase [Spirochaetales bacterium]|nr:FAD:protein FMN transferase [Spirochaetales bacterium]
MKYIPFLLCTAVVSCGPYLFRESRPALSLTNPIPVTVVIYTETEPDWDAMYRFLNERAVLFDHRAGESPVRELNENGCADMPESVYHVIRTACDIARKSGGAFDPTVLPLLVLWQFDRGEKLSGLHFTAETDLAPPESGAIDEVLDAVDYKKIRFEEGRRICLPEGTRIDLGGIAKGACIDLLADYCESMGYSRFLIEAGGDIIVSGLKPGEKQWKIDVQHPRRLNDRAGILSIGEAGERFAIVTSGDYERGFEYGGKWYHHLLDPHTGYPAEGAVSVTVVAKTATIADALSTACFVLGFGKGLALLEAEEGVEGLVLREEGEALGEGTTEGFGRYYEDVLQ